MDQQTRMPAVGPLPEIPGYRLEERIADGGMGSVYRAVQLSLGRTVAIKILKPSAEDGRFGHRLEEFERESRLLASLNHPNVVTIHDFGKAAGRCYLVLEWAPAATLREKMVAGEPWPIARALPIIRAIASALAYIHRQGVLHLDLKPENVLVGAQGEVKISDFGIAMPSTTAGLTQGHMTRGTLDYAAPEQRHGLLVDHRTDQFALATVAYELLTGTLPGRAYVSCLEFNPKAPIAVDQALKRALERLPEDRYPRLEDFDEALQARVEPYSRLRNWTAGAILGFLLGVLFTLLGINAWPSDSEVVSQPVSHSSTPSDASVSPRSGVRK